MPFSPRLSLKNVVRRRNFTLHEHISTVAGVFVSDKPLHELRIYVVKDTPPREDKRNGLHVYVTSDVPGGSGSAFNFPGACIVDDIRTYMYMYVKQVSELPMLLRNNVTIRQCGEHICRIRANTNINQPPLKLPSPTESLENLIH